MAKRKVVVVSDHISGSKSANAVNVREMAKGFAFLEDVDVIVIRKSSASLKYKSFEIIEEEKYSETSLIKQHLAVGLRRIHFSGLVNELLALRPSFVYARSQNGALAAIRAKIPFVIETHKPPTKISLEDSAFFETVGKSPMFRGLITISPILSRAYESHGVPVDKISIIADPVDTRLFMFNLDLEANTKIEQRVFYAGHLYAYKGIETLLLSAKTLPHVEFRLAGGLIRDISKTQKHIELLGLNNINILGWLDRETVAHEMSQNQVLIIPNESWHESASWTSPMKLGEYLATGNPIVASDIPAHKYWLQDVPVNFFVAGDHAALAHEISKVLQARHKANDAKSRRRAAENFSLENRIRKIMEIIQ